MSGRAVAIWLGVIVVGFIILMLGKLYPRLTILLIPLILILPLYSILSGDTGYNRSNEDD